MPVVVTCDSCGMRMSAPDELAGKHAKCPKCRTILVVPPAASGVESDESLVRPARARIIQPPTAPAVAGSVDDRDRSRLNRHPSSDGDEYGDRPGRGRRRSRDDDSDDEDSDLAPRVRSRRRDGRSRSEGPKQVSVLGILSLVQGIGSLIASLMPCVGVVGAIGGLIGVILGGIGIVVAKRSGRQGLGLPIAGTAVSGVSILIGLAWFAIGAAVFKTAEKVAERQEQAAQEGAREVREAPAGDVIAVTAAKLDEEYDENELKADAKYKGKVVELTGQVARVSRDKPGKITVELDTREDCATIDCDFSSTAEPELAQVDVGRRITIRGMCKGILRRTASITLENCVLVKDAQKPKAEGSKPADPPAGGGRESSRAGGPRPAPGDQPVPIAVKPRMVERPSSGVSSLTVSPDGRQFAVGVAKGKDFADAWEIQLWDFASGKMDRVLHKLDGEDEPKAMTYSPDGRTLAVATITGEVRLYDLPGGKLRKTFRTDDRPEALRYSANGKLLVWSSARFSRPNRVIAWDTESGSEALNFRVPEKEKLELLYGGADVTADGKTVLIPYGGGPFSKDSVTYLTFWNLPGTEPARTVPLKKPADGARLAPDGKAVALTGIRTLDLYDVATMTPIKSFDHGLSRMWFSSDGRVLAGMHGPKEVMFVDMDTFVRRVINIPAAWGEAFFSATGDRLVCMTSPTLDEPEPTRFLLYDLRGVK